MLQKSYCRQTTEHQQPGAAQRLFTARDQAGATCGAVAMPQYHGQRQIPSNTSKQMAAWLQMICVRYSRVCGSASVKRQSIKV